MISSLPVKEDPSDEVSHCRWRMAPSVKNFFLGCTLEKWEMEWGRGSLKRKGKVWLTWMSFAELEADLDENSGDRFSK